MIADAWPGQPSGLANWVPMHVVDRLEGRGSQVVGAALRSPRRRPAWEMEVTGSYVVVLMDAEAVEAYSYKFISAAATS